MNPGHTITIAPADIHVEVRVDGEKVAESDHPVTLDETGYPTRYYFRREDVRMDLFRPTSFKTQCPFKGDASYFTSSLATPCTTASRGHTNRRSRTRKNRRSPLASSTTGSTSQSLHELTARRIR